MTNIFEIFIRDESKNRIAQLEKFTSFSCIRRYNAIGTWALQADASVLNFLSKKGGIEVVRNGEIYFSGDMNEFEDQNGLTMTGAGFSDEDILAGRLALPEPAGPPYSVDYDVRSGYAEAIIKEYVENNAGLLANAARVIEGLSAEANYGRGESVTGRARFDVLYDLVISLATQGSVGIRIIGSQLEVYIPEDKSGTIVFSKEMGTLGAYTYKETRGKANYVICGGSGEGSARTFVEVANSESVLNWGRREKFLDKSSTSSVVELTAAAQEDLDKNGDVINLTCQPIITEKMVPIDDYDIGDWIGVVMYGQPLKQRVQEIKLTLDKSGAELIDLAIGTNGATTDPTGLQRVYARMREIQNRVSAKERT